MGTESEERVASATSAEPRLQPRAPGDEGGLRCNRCGFEVRTRAMGCKNPCPNCGTVYPLGDCSD